MTPTPEQKQWLRDYLYQIMQYRETFEEVYDHILLALEDEPKREFFETNVLNILERDFGGMNGLLQLEENCRQSVNEMATVQFKDNFKRWFAPPLVLFTAIFFVAMIYLELSPVKTGISLATLFIVLLILPVVICSVRGARLGYKFGATKKSIKDEIFKSLAFKANRILLNMVMISTWVQAVTGYLFNLNKYLSLLLGVLVIFILVWPHIKQYRKNLKGDNPKKLRFIPRTEKLFLGWYVWVTLAVDFIAKFLTHSTNLALVTPDPRPIFAVFYSIITGILVLMMINILATIKLYRSEFKTTMIPN